MRFFEIIDQVLSYYPGADTPLLEKAYIFAAKEHRGRLRMKDEPYLRHPLAVAGILANMRLDEESVAAGLLHDILDERNTTAETVEELFGATIAGIVQGGAKLGRLDLSNRQEQQTEYMRKMILALSRDIRVILVKLADRLDDMRSIHDLPSESEVLHARETLDIYAPLAARLGIDWMKQELENLAFKCLEPEAYEGLLQGLAKTEEDRRRYIYEVKQELTSRLNEYGLKGRVSGRPKHLYSIHQKMKRQNLDIHRVYDLIAFRLIVDSVKTSYEALGMVHELWEPVKGRFKDYIVKPKSNMYQSLHTTVIGPRGEQIEVQIRTEEMNRIANEGIAAHWLYKEGKPLRKVDTQETQHFSMLREQLEGSNEPGEARSFLDMSKLDFYPDEVYVFTPLGEVKALPRGSTPLDFAYDVHSEVGHRCVGARVNGKLVPLRQELQNGDTVEIVTAAGHHPSKDWLKFVKTTKAINRIRHWIKAQERVRSVSLGREICEREFRKKGLNFNNYINSPDLLEVAKSFSLRDVDGLLAGVGFRKISPQQVVGRLPSIAQEDEDHGKEDTIAVEKSKAGPTNDGIEVRGVDDVMIHLARCCTPVPGEPITGYITRGRGVTVHRVGCKNLIRSDAERRLDVQWAAAAEQVYPVDIRVAYSGDRRMLTTLSGVLGQLNVSVVDMKMEPPANDLNICRLRIEVKNTQHLQKVLSVLRGEKGVYRVQRNML